MTDITVTPKAEPSDVRLPDSTISLAVLPIKSFLGIDSLDNKDIDQLEYVRSVFGEDVGFGEILHELSEIERKLGSPKLGETRLSKIYRYMRAQQTVKQSEKLRDALLQ